VTIRARLYAALAVTIAGLIATAGVGIVGMSRLGDRFDAVERASQAQALALQLKFGVTDFNGWQTAYGYDDGKSRPTFLSSVERFRADLAEARRRLTRPQEQAYLNQIEDAFDDFMRLDEQAYAALQAGRTEAVKRILLGPELVHFGRAAAAAQRLAGYEAGRVSVEDKEFKEARHDALRLLIAVSAIAGLLVIILLITANDLARTAERKLARDARPDQDQG
jgi:methyl-accepting chemotaxis protein